METTRTSITPVKQAFVEIAGHMVLAFLLPDGRIAAAFRMICNLLGINHRGQIRSVQADSTIADLLLLVKMEIMGTPQEMNVIVAEAIPMWLANIHESKVSPEARETLREFQRVAVQTLRAFFFPETKAQQHSAPPKEESEQPSLPPPEPEPFPPLGDEARYEYQEAMYHAHDGLERHLRSIDARLLTLTRQMAEVWQVLNQHADMLNEHLEALLRHKEMLEQHREQLRALRARPDGESGQMNALIEQVKRLEGQVSGLTAQVARLEAARSLTPEHHVELRTWMRALAHQTGQQTPVLERELTAAFGVETISQLTEAIWDEVAAWFHQRLGW